MIIYYSFFVFSSQQSIRCIIIIIFLAFLHFAIYLSHRVFFFHSCILFYGSDLPIIRDSTLPSRPEFHFLAKYQLLHSDCSFFAQPYFTYMYIYIEKIFFFLLLLQSSRSHSFHFVYNSSIELFRCVLIHICICIYSALRAILCKMNWYGSLVPVLYGTFSCLIRFSTPIHTRNEAHEALCLT